MTASAKLGITYMTANQAQKEVTFNEALNILDALAQSGIVDRDLATPPGTPAEGAAYIVATSPTGAWVGYAGYIAAYYSGWIFLSPKEGWTVYIQDEDCYVTYTGAAWTTNIFFGSAGNIGIGAAAGTNCILDMTSTTKAMRFPRMTTTQKGAIDTPSAGMTVYDSTLNKLCVYTGAAWETVTSA